MAKTKNKFHNSCEISDSQIYDVTQPNVDIKTTFKITHEN